MIPRVLIVDDDEKNTVLIAEKMNRDGYETETASNGLDAIEKVKTFRPDLILMDVMMPRMDGYEALKRLKEAEQTRYIPVIMLTGKSEIEDKVIGFESGAEDYIIKPFSLKEMSARVKSFLRMRALQQQLIETEKMAALGEMVDGIAHEVRNPLTALGGVARRLYEHEVDDAQRKEYAQRIIKSVERLERMLQRIDEYKRILSSRPTRADVNALVKEAVKDIMDVIEGRDISVETRLMADPPPVEIDYGNMRIALFNVLKNSVEAVENGGVIKVETLDGGSNTVAIRVSDDGVGIRKDDLRRIFNPFQTTKREGAGMGLTIVSRVINDHKGTIDVQSEPGKGTTVTLRVNASAVPV